MVCRMASMAAIPRVSRQVEDEPGAAHVALSRLPGEVGHNQGLEGSCPELEQ